MIHPEAVRYFIELAQTQHMSRAADRLGVTQPTLSHSLKRLEEEVGSELFTRTKKGLTLTPAGTRFYEKCHELLAVWQALAASVHDEVREVKGKIRLGCHTAVAQYTVPLLLPKLLKAHPELTVSLTHGLSRHMTEMVVSSQLDLALAVNPQPHPDLIVKEFARDRVAVWGLKNCLNPDVLLADPNLLQTQDILNRMAKKGLHFKRVVESSSLEVMTQLMCSGTGAAILPERVLRAFAVGKVQMLKDSPVFEDRICAVYKPEFRKLKRGEVFLEFLWSVFHKRPEAPG